MGASAGRFESFLGSESIECHDIRSKRLRNAPKYKRTIQEFENKVDEFLPPSIHMSYNIPIRCVCRKRPVNTKEDTLNDFDVLSLSRSDEHHILWIHKCGIRLDMKHLYIEHHGYVYDNMFSEKDTSSSIFDYEIQPKLKLVMNHENQALEWGNDCSIIAFGATGSGKTYTMNAISALSIQYMLDTLQPGDLLRVCCVEVIGNTVHDLLLQGDVKIDKDNIGTLNKNSSTELVLRENEHGETVMVGVTYRYISTIDEYEAVAETVKQQRITKATSVHAQSSRSHLITQVTPVSKGGEVVVNATAVSGSGNVYLVDLAGSEWSQDQVSHTYDLVQESKYINASLMVLKQCLREKKRYELVKLNKISSVPVPVEGEASPAQTTHSLYPSSYRESKLTRILKSCLTVRNDEYTSCESVGGVSARKPTVSNSIVVIATLSPTSADTEHSMVVASNTSVGINVTSEEDVINTTMNGTCYLMSNVIGEAELNWDSSKGYVDDTDPSVSTGVATMTSGGQWKTKPVKEWTSEEVCEWFVDCSSDCMKRLNAKYDAQLRMGTDMSVVANSKDLPQPPKPDNHNRFRKFSVTFSASKWAKMQGIEGGDSIGLGFTEKTIPNNGLLSSVTPGVSSDESMTVATVSKVFLNKGYIQLNNRKGFKNNVTVGDVLLHVKCNGVEDNETKVLLTSEGSDAKEVLKTLKQSLKLFKVAVQEQREYEDKKTKFMTKDMKILRDYIMNGVAPPVPEVSVQEQDVVDDTEGEKSVVEEEPTLEPVPPTDMKLTLTFMNLEMVPTSAVESRQSIADERSGSPQAIHTEVATVPFIYILPEVPRIFTGESRTGTVWTGKELVEKYYYGNSDGGNDDVGDGSIDISNGLSRMIKTCNGNIEFGTEMHNELGKIVQQQQ